MADKKLLIADGHHRYETALAFRDENPGLPGADQRHDDVRQHALARAEDPGHAPAGERHGGFHARLPGRRRAASFAVQRDRLARRACSEAWDERPRRAPSSARPSAIRLCHAGSASRAGDTRRARAARAPARRGARHQRRGRARRAAPALHPRHRRRRRRRCAPARRRSPSC